MKNLFGIIVLLWAPLLVMQGYHRKNESLPPNILFILADDLGTDVPGYYGGSSYHTPNIDRLAREGILFTNCYSAPLCSPSRVKLLTGRYGFRTGQVWGYIPPQEITFGQILKQAGYKTALAGKWQMALLKDDPDHIRNRGFDESCVFGWHEGPRYYDPLIYQNGKISGNPRKWVYQEWEGKAWICNRIWKLYNDNRLFNIPEDPADNIPCCREMTPPKLNRKENICQKS